MSEPEDQNPEKPAAESAEESERDFPLPPASFEYLVFSLRTQAELYLGLLHFGEEKDRPKPDLRAAQHSIDMLGVLSEKTQGNLTVEEQRLLENSLTELRFRYVQAAGTSQAK